MMKVGDGGRAAPSHVRVPPQPSAFELCLQGALAKSPRRDTMGRARTRETTGNLCRLACFARRRSRGDHRGRDLAPAVAHACAPKHAGRNLRGTEGTVPAWSGWTRWLVVDPGRRRRIRTARHLSSRHFWMAKGAHSGVSCGASCASSTGLGLRRSVSTDGSSRSGGEASPLPTNWDPLVLVG